MLVFGTASPSEPNSHSGVLIRERDIEDIARSGALVGKKVLIEHMGEPVGEVVSAWQHGTRLDCVLRIDKSNPEGRFAQSFIKTGRCPELSLGYKIAMQQSDDGHIEGGTKEVVEVSLVKKGARHECFIHAFAN